MGLQQVKRFSPACPSAAHLSKQSYWSRPLCHTWAILGWGGKSILGTLTFFFFFSPTLSAWFLEKGCEKRSAQGLHGETELLESWAQNLPPAAADVSLQLFMLQMDKMVVSTG